MIEPLGFGSENYRDQGQLNRDGERYSNEIERRKWENDEMDNKVEEDKSEAEGKSISNVKLMR